MASELETETTEPSLKKSKNENDDQTVEASQQNVNNLTKNLGETPPNPLSKNQLKKQKKLANFERIKKEKRLKERERIKRKRQEAIAQGLPSRTGPSRKELKKKQETKQLGTLRAVIDLDYDELMQDRDLSKCVKQCLRIYTINRRAEKPARLYFTGIKRDGRIHGVMKKNDGYENWDVDYHFDAGYAEVFQKDEIIYLTSDSDNVLERLQPEKVYIIGGLVDHNHQKGLCHERATKLGIQTARLPLNEHVDMKTRTVLSTFHVFELLLHVSDGESWTDAILKVIPMRKGAKPKDANTSDKLVTASINNDAVLPCGEMKNGENESEPIDCAPKS